MIFFVLVIASAIIALISFNLKIKKANKGFERLAKRKGFNNWEELTEKTKELRKSNNQYFERSGELNELRSKSRDLEKNNEYQKAINLYLEEIALGEKHENLRYANYAHSIKRVIILYGKTKQFQKLKEFLDLNIRKYPNSSEIEDWNKRLDKVNSKIKK